VTSIICWLNNDDYFQGLWAVADSRVTASGGVLSDNAPKLFSVPVYCYGQDDWFHQRPIKILNPMFGFAGSTFIGLNVKEVLTNYLGNLEELSYYGSTVPTFEERTPTIREIAELTKRIGEIYLHSVGRLTPAAARFEFVLFGFCRKSDAFKVFTLSNSPANPATITIAEHAVSMGDFLILGDKKEEVGAAVVAMRAQLIAGSSNWRRAPITVMANILRNEEEIATIGGHLQLWAALRYENRLLTISHTESRLPQYLGIDMFDTLGQVGGFTTGFSTGLSPPGVEGWPHSDAMPDDGSIC
jgi:hypothetical protein